MEGKISTTPPSTGREVRKGKNKGLITFLAILILVAVSVAGGVFVGVNYWNAENQDNNQEMLTEDEKQLLLANIGEHIIISNEEEPLIVIINNAEQLRQQQAFFQSSRDNDILVVYQDKALIFRPSEDVLVNVGPVYINNATQQIIDQKITLDIRNGSGIIGRAASLGNELDSKDAYEVVSMTNASSSDYQGTVLVNLSGKDISSLEGEFGVRAVNDLPEGEVGSSADVVIILGN